MRVIRRLLIVLRRRVAAQDGIVLLYALGAMVVILGLTGAALAAVTYDTSGTQSDTNQKQAYAAAEAGIQRYLFNLNTNNTYWTQCNPSSAPWIVNTNSSVPVAQAEPASIRASVPGSSTETYAVMLLPAAGSTYTACSTADPVDSMIQSSGANAGTLRISSTGYAGNAQRTVVAAIRQQNFLNYAYFTNYETSDPLVQVDDAFASTNDADTAIEPTDQCGSNPPTGCGSLYQTALTGGTVNGTTYPGAAGTTSTPGQCVKYRSAGRESQPFFSNTYGATLAYRAQIQADGPTTFWPLSDTSGTTAADVSGNGNSGTYSTVGVTKGTTSPVESSSGKGVTFTGTTAATAGGVVSSLSQVGPTVYSEELWFKTTTAGGVLTEFGNSLGNFDRVIYLNTSGNVVFGTFPGYVVTIQSPAAYNNGQWHMVVATQGSDGMHLYIDGVQVASNTTTTAQSYTGSWRVGGTSNNSVWTGSSTTVPFQGSMSDAALFTTELSASQIQTEYNASPVSSNYVAPSSGQTLTAYCTNIDFIAGDAINGPFHSNDSVLLCGSPTFGRSGYHDSIEFGGDKSVYPNGYVEDQGCSGSPNLASGATLTPIDTHLNMPTIGSLSSSADVTTSGTTCVNLTSTYVQVAQLTLGSSCIGLAAGSYTNYPWSKFTGGNGVLYVNGSSTAQCNYSYDVDSPVYTPTSSTIGCGTVFVSGQTQYPLTIGAAQDIVIDGNLTYPSPNNTGAMLGLIAQGFIRVYHPVTGGVCTSSGASNAFPSGSSAITQISAAMLSLSHSFIVDDYSCGSNLGTLNVNGAIAQYYRGTVGSGSAGYTKNYVYDPRLAYSEPPHFLAPTNGAYAIAYQTECEPTPGASVNACDGTS